MITLNSEPIHTTSKQRLHNMTHDPRLPTLEQIMDDNNSYEIIDSPVGRMERWRASTLMTAGIQHYVQVRDDAIEATTRLHETLARADAAIARRGLIKHLADQMAEISKRVDVLEARHRADAEREERERLFEEEPLSEPPGTNEPEPAEIKDDEPPPGISATDPLGTARLAPKTRFCW